MRQTQNIEKTYYFTSPELENVKQAVFLVSIKLTPTIQSLAPFWIAKKIDGNHVNKI